MSVSTLNAAIADIKNTSSGLVEHDDPTESMPLTLEEIAAMMVDRVPHYTTSTAMALTEGTESKLAYLAGEGLFVWYDTATQPRVVSPDYPYYDTASGYWAKKRFDYLGKLADVDDTGKSAGKFLKWNGTKWVPDIPTVASIAYGNVTGKPDITGTTDPVIGGNPSAPGTLTIGALVASGNSSINGDLLVSDDLTVTDAAVIGGVASVGATLTVTGNVAVNTNKFNVTASNGNTAIAGTLAATGNATLGADLAVAGDITGNALLISGAAALNSGVVVTGNVSADGFYSVLPVYANNAAALAALGANRFYRTGDAVMISH